jgi:hypothetical protein
VKSEDGFRFCGEIWSLTSESVKQGHWHDHSNRAYFSFSWARIRHTLPESCLFEIGYQIPACLELSNAKSMSVKAILRLPRVVHRLVEENMASGQVACFPTGLPIHQVRIQVL